MHLAAGPPDAAWATTAQALLNLPGTPMPTLRITVACLSIAALSLAAGCDRRGGSPNEVPGTPSPSTSPSPTTTPGPSAMPPASAASQ